MAGDLRVAILGCGLAAGLGNDETVWSHPRAIAELAGLRLALAFDPDAARLAAFCAQWGCVAAESPESLLGQGPDILLICAPTSLHEHYLSAALAAGITTVVCEKPLVGDADTARRLVKAYGAAGHSLYVYYPRRWIGAVRELAAEIAAGSWGQPLGFHGWYGKGVLTIGCHSIDLIRMLLGPAVRVMALDRPVGGTAPGELTPDIRLGLASGVSGLLQSYDYSRYALTDLDLLFEEGRVRLTDLGFRIQRWRRVPSPHFAGFFELASEGPAETDYARAALGLWRRVRDSHGGAPVVDDGDCLSLGVIDAVARSLQTGREENVHSGD